MVLTHHSCNIRNRVRLLARSCNPAGECCGKRMQQLSLLTVVAQACLIITLMPTEVNSTPAVLVHVLDTVTQVQSDLLFSNSSALDEITLSGEQTTEEPVWNQLYATRTYYLRGRLVLRRLKLEQATLSPPDEAPLLPAIFFPGPNVSVVLDHVTITTTCQTLDSYRRYACAAQPSDLVQVHRNWVYFQDWQDGPVHAIAVNVTCTLLSSPPPDNTTLALSIACLATSVTSASQLFAALATWQVLLHTNERLIITLNNDISLTLAAWPSSANITHNVTIASVASRQVSADLQLRKDLFQLDPQSDTSALTLQGMCLENMPLGLCTASTFPRCLLSVAMSSVTRNNRSLSIAASTLVLFEDEFAYMAYWLDQVTSPILADAIEAQWLGLFITVRPGILGAPLAVLFPDEQPIGLQSIQLASANRVFPRLLTKSGLGQLMLPPGTAPLSAPLPLTALQAATDCNSLADILFNASYNPTLDRTTVVLIANISVTGCTWPNLASSPYPLRSLKVSGTLGGQLTVLDVAATPSLVPVLDDVELSLLTVVNNGLPRDLSFKLTHPVWAFNISSRPGIALRMGEVVLQVPPPELELIRAVYYNTTMPTYYKMLPMAAQLRVQVYMQRSLLIAADSHNLVFQDLNSLSIQGQNVTLTTNNPSDFRLLQVTLPYYGPVNTTESQVSSQDHSASTKQHQLALGLGIALPLTALFLGSLMAMLLYAGKRKRAEQVSLAKYKDMGPFTELAPAGAEYHVLNMQGSPGSPSTLLQMDTPSSAHVDSLEETAEAACAKVSQDAAWELSGVIDAVHSTTDFADMVELLEVLGRGAQGTVHRGIWKGLEVAVKTCQFIDSDAGDPRRRGALTEAAICYNVHHPNVVATYQYDIRQADSHVGLAMPRDSDGSVVPGASNIATFQAMLKEWNLHLIQEYCAGGTLKLHIDSSSLASPSGQPSMPKVLKAAIDMATGMAYIHSIDIIHGDLNPNNVLLSHEDLAHPHAAFKISDFGLSTKLSAHQSHLSNMRQGTLNYISPEVYAKGLLTKAADVFSYGIILWELYHGTPPWRKKRQQLIPATPTVKGLSSVASSLEFAADCPADYVSLCRACMTPSVAGRPTFQGILQQLQQMQNTDEA